MGWSGSFALNAFPHHNFKMLWRKLNAVGIPFSILSSSDLPCELFFLIIMDFNLCICVLRPDYELLGWQISLFSEPTCRTESDRNDSSPSSSQDPHQANWFTSLFSAFLPATMNFTSCYCFLLGNHIRWCLIMVLLLSKGVAIFICLKTICLS